MLTSEEERERAVKVGKLYLQPLERPNSSSGESQSGFVSWSGVLKPAFTLIMSILVANSIVTVFTNTTYGFKEDVAAAGMLFILALMIGSYVAYRAFKYFYDGLYYNTSHHVLIFWLSLFFLAPVLFMSRGIIINSSDHNLTSILLHLALHGLLYILVSVGFIALTTYILEKLEKPEPTRLWFVYMLTSLPYFLGMIFSFINHVY